MNLVKTLALLGMVAIAAPSAGCTFTTDDNGSSPPVIIGTPGTLTIDYTIEGTKDPNICADYGIADIELQILTTDGESLGNKYGNCSAFSVSLDLTPGRYDAEITLVDGARNSASVTKQLFDLDVIEDRELVDQVDFPPDSIL